MESNMLDLMIMPVSVAMAELLAGCWAVSTVVGWLGQLAGSGRCGEADADASPAAASFVDRAGFDEDWRAS